MKDHTEIQESQPAQRMTMVARGWPAGEALVDLTLHDDPEGTRIDMYEEPVRGPGAWLNNPAVDAIGKRRLNETLDRLARIVEGRHGAQASRLRAAPTTRS